jgi:tetratricopeptide (TPR) repeat protein
LDLRKEVPMSYRRIRFGVALSAWLVATAFAASAEGESEAPECNSLEAAASPPCARFLHETTRLHNLASAYERMGNHKLALDTYSQAVASAKRPIELFLADTIPATALRRRGLMHRELGQLQEAMADFSALIDADRGNSDAHNARARTLLELGRLEDALVDIDAAAWLKPYASDLHRVRAQILTRLGRREEATAAATLAEEYELSQAQELQQLKFPLFSAAPTFVRQRFLLQIECQDDDRHVLSLRLDRGRVSVTPSYAGAAGTMTVEETDDRLLFVMGAEPCQVRVIVGMGDLLTDTPPARNDSLRKSVGRQSGALDIEREFHPSSTYGCASGSATVRVYWGSVDYSYFLHQARVQRRLDQPNAQHSKHLLYARFVR